MSDISKLEKTAIFFPKTMVANDVIYSGGETYNIHHTPGTIDRWLKRGCQMGDPKSAKPDPRLSVKNEEVLVVESKDAKPKSRKNSSEKPVEENLK